MHYKAEETVTSGQDIRTCIPTFLLMNSHEFEIEDIIRLTEIMETEISRGSSFDMEFFKECRFHLRDYFEPNFGSTDEEKEACNSGLTRLDNIENQNIINTHKNSEKAMSKNVILYKPIIGNIATTT